ncbi:hypothetical protein JXB11_00740 [Candidatus Woesearchaeota archaeon]|nr:hypothetical protein [Candidatus Woesearchaeota archaeon]
MLEENPKTIDLMKVLLEVRYIPSYLRFFVISKRKYLRLYNGRISESWQAQEFGIVRGMKLERGDILDFFAKLEFLISELIRIKLLGFYSKKTHLLDALLDSTDFYSKIRVLRKWKLINGKLEGKIIAAKEVRNGFAHNWDKYEVVYKEKLITHNFAEFKKDMEEIFDELLVCYNKEQKKLDMDKIIKKIKDFDKKQSDKKTERK